MPFKSRIHRGMIPGQASYGTPSGLPTGLGSTCTELYRITAGSRVADPRMNGLMQDGTAESVSRDQK